MKRALAIVALCVGAVLFSAAPAWAHSFLVDSTPAEGEVLTTLPDTFSVSANESLLDIVGDGTGFGMLIEGPDGLYYEDGTVVIDGATLSTPALLGAAGDYTLVWQLVSADGHPVSGEIPFSWEPPADFEPATGHALTTASPEPAETSEEVDVSGLLWIGGAILAVLLAVGVTLLVVRRK
jgi:methionine-rich copper-binding protein CopC